MLLNEHLYCVAITFKMTERIEQWICIKLCIKLEHSFTETIWMTQKAAAVGNWYWAAASPRRTHSYITPHAEFLGKTSNYPADSGPLGLIFGALPLLAFPKTKITFESEEILNHQWDSEKYDGAANDNWELCEVPSCLLWRELRTHYPMHNASCICIFFNKCLFFILHGWILARQTRYIRRLYHFIVSENNRLVLQFIYFEKLLVWSPPLKNHGKYLI